MRVASNSLKYIFLVFGVSMILIATAMVLLLSSAHLETREFHYPIRGVALDYYTDEPITNATIKFYDSSGSLVDTVKTDVNGTFETTETFAPLSEIYIQPEKDGYYPLVYRVFLARTNISESAFAIKLYMYPVPQEVKAHSWFWNESVSIFENNNTFEYNITQNTSVMFEFSVLYIFDKAPLSYVVWNATEYYSLSILNISYSIEPTNGTENYTVGLQLTSTKPILKDGIDQNASYLYIATIIDEKEGATTYRVFVSPTNFTGNITLRFSLAFKTNVLLEDMSGDTIAVFDGLEIILRVS